LVVALAACAAAASAQAPSPRRDWNRVVAQTPAGTHVLGNPAAKIRLTEYISYTCPHCAEFEREAEATLRLGFVATGEGSVEVRHFVRDPVDMTVALLTNCGPPAKFFANHTAFLRSQPKWIATLASSGPSRRARWTTGAFAARTRAIAQDFGFHAIMRGRGYTPAQVDKCLANQVLAERLAAATDEAQETLRIPGTPSFAIDGVVLAGTHDWATLKPQLEARLRAG
jgi:protein-disulfide isomerase